MKKRLRTICLGLSMLTLASCGEKEQNVFIYQTRDTSSYCEDYKENDSAEAKDVYVYTVLVRNKSGETQTLKKEDFTIVKDKQTYDCLYFGISFRFFSFNNESITYIETRRDTFDVESSNNEIFNVRPVFAVNLSDEPLIHYQGKALQTL